MKRENCPFCGHRWIRKSSESPITCPKCRNTYKRKDTGELIWKPSAK